MATTKDLTGTYGQTGNNATTDDISSIIRKNSYCAGTRDDLLLIVPSTSDVALNSRMGFSISAPANSMIDAVIEIPGKPSIKVSALSEYDPYAAAASAYIEVVTGAVPGNINLKIVSFNNYPLFQDAIPITVMDFDPGTLPEPGIYVYVDKDEQEIGGNFTGTVTLTNLIVNDSYTVTFRNFLTDELIVGINDFLDAVAVIATAETMTIPFSVPSAVFTNLETLITASIFSNRPPPPPDEA